MRVVLEGEPPIEIAVRRNRRARRLSLRVSRLDGRVTLSLPESVALDEAWGFARSREGWMRRVIAEAPPRQTPLPGGTLPIEGRAVALRACDGGRIRLADGVLHVPADRPCGPALAAWLRERARSTVHALVTHHAGQAGRDFGRITLRDTRSRWGSCSGRGDLMFSWRLAMAPPEVLDYVVAHEVAHLVHMDHSPRFWAVTERLCPEWRDRRGWLRANGDALQRVDFGA